MPIYFSGSNNNFIMNDRFLRTVGNSKNSDFLCCASNTNQNLICRKYYLHAFKVKKLQNTFYIVLLDMII